MSEPEEKAWDTDCSMSRAALYKFTYALIHLGGYFTNSLTIGCKGYTPQQNARNTVFFRIFLPVGREEEFRVMTGMKLKSPPVVHVNMSTPHAP